MDGKGMFYDLLNYVSKERWGSYFEQVHEILSSAGNPRELKILEIGPGRNLLKRIILDEVNLYHTYDVDDRSEATYRSAEDLASISDEFFDCVVAFQVLEHMPIEESELLFAEMTRLASNTVIISLPNAKPMWKYSFYIPKWRHLNLLVPNPFWKSPQNISDGNHFWELERQGYSSKKILAMLESAGNVRLVKSYRIFDNAYHHMAVFKKHE
jgi:hypothetical protein